MCQAFGQRSIRAITKLTYKYNVFRGLPHPPKAGWQADPKIYYKHKIFFDLIFIDHG